MQVLYTCNYMRILFEGGHMKIDMLSKTLVMGVIILFVGVSVITSTGEINTLKININDGSLLGYVNDTSGNPIEGALVRVYFHGTYEEDYSDSNGYYHVTNIPICWCIKNCTASKEGYETDWVLLGIYENTTYDFVLTSLTQYNGSLSGYVNCTDMDPIEGALVRVHFHGTYEEGYSDEEGYYHVTNIPICYCLKNATCSKECYTTEWVLLSIVENTTYDFILNTTNHPPKAPKITDPGSVPSESIKVIVEKPINSPPGKPIEFRFEAIDPDGDNMRYHIDWGDGCFEMTGFYHSGEEVKVNHTFNFQGIYTVSAFAEDICGFKGLVGTLSIPITQNKKMIYPIFFIFLERLPMLERFLNSIQLR